MSLINALYNSSLFAQVISISSLLMLSCFPFFFLGLSLFCCIIICHVLLIMLNSLVIDLTHLISSIKLCFIEIKGHK